MDEDNSSIIDQLGPREPICAPDYMCFVSDVAHLCVIGSTGESASPVLSDEGTRLYGVPCSCRRSEGQAEAVASDRRICHHHQSESVTSA